MYIYTHLRTYKNKKQREPKIDLCGTPKEIFPKSESLLSLLTRNICSER